MSFPSFLCSSDHNSKGAILASFRKAATSKLSSVGQKGSPTVAQNCGEVHSAGVCKLSWQGAPYWRSTKLLNCNVCLRDRYNCGCGGCCRSICCETGTDGSFDVKWWNACVHIQKVRYDLERLALPEMLSWISMFYLFLMVVFIWEHNELFDNRWTSWSSQLLSCRFFEISIEVVFVSYWLVIHGSCVIRLQVNCRTLKIWCILSYLIVRCQEQWKTCKNCDTLSAKAVWGGQNNISMMTTRNFLFQ